MLVDPVVRQERPEATGRPHRRGAWPPGAGLPVSSRSRRISPSVKKTEALRGLIRNTQTHNYVVLNRFGLNSVRLKGFGGRSASSQCQVEDDVSTFHVLSPHPVCALTVRYVVSVRPPTRTRYKTAVG